MGGGKTTVSINVQMPQCHSSIVGLISRPLYHPVVRAIKNWSQGRSGNKATDFLPPSGDTLSDGTQLSDNDTSEQGL